jgi:hypothetical protein
MKHHLYLLIAMFLGVLSASAQTTQRSSTGTDSAKTPKLSLTLATIYNSNINYYGQTAAERLPSVLTYAGLQLPYGFSLSGHTFKAFDSQPGLSGYSLSAGYTIDLTGKLSAGLNYTHSSFPDSTSLLQSANQDMVSASLSYDWQWLTTGLDADYSLGNDQVLYTTLKATKIIDPRISITKSDYITIEPSVEVIGSTQRFSYMAETADENEDLNGLPSLPVDPLPGKGNGHGKRSGIGNGKLSKIITPGGGERRPISVTSTQFDFLTYGFSIPVVYNRTNYFVQATYEGVVLSKAVSDSQKLRSFFNLGFYYTF